MQLQGHTTFEPSLFDFELPPQKSPGEFQARGSWTSTGLPISCALAAQIQNGQHPGHHHHKSIIVQASFSPGKCPSQPLGDLDRCQALMEGSPLGCWLLTGWVAALAVPGCNKAARHPRSANQGSARAVETASEFQESQGVYSEASLPSPTAQDAAAVWKGRIWTESRLNNSVMRSRSLFGVLQIRPFQRDKREVLGPLLGSIIPRPTKMYWRKTSCWKRKGRQFCNVSFEKLFSLMMVLNFFWVLGKQNTMLS